MFIAIGFAPPFASAEGAHAYPGGARSNPISGLGFRAQKNLRETNPGG